MSEGISAYNGGRPRKSKHGFARRGQHILEWDRWMAMISRCTNPSASNYSRYGGRGIQVCEKWRNSFTEFFRDVGKAPSRNHTLDRIDNMRGYEPGNVRWATRSEQQNNRRGNCLVTYNGQTFTVTQWSRLCGINQRTLDHRIKSNWPLDEAMNTPASKKNPKHYV